MPVKRFVSLAVWKGIPLILALLLPSFVQAAPLQRVANTTLQMPASPQVFGYASSNAFGTLVFNNPVAIVSPPGETNRLFVLEKRGRIIAITNLAAPTRTMFLDLTGRVLGSDSLGEERGLLGLAFHPGYATNRYFYVFYTGTATTAVPGGSSSMHDILARFRTSASNPNQADAASELRLIQQYDQADNHNGGDLHFGPDGYLYVSLGDEGGGDDQFNNSQRIDKDYFAGILRLDVDQRPGNLPPNSHPAVTANYAVPSDNPFIGATSFNGLTVNPNNVRTEFWAVGLRNPWRMSFDPGTGTLFCGDVGQNAREEVAIITKGRNYGWNYREGFSPGPNSGPPAGFVQTLPLLDYPRSLGYCIIGGVVYRGNRISQLYGAYVYGDYGSGRIWALWNSGTNVTQNTQLLIDAGVTAFGIDPSNGDILYANQRSGNNGTIHRIYYSTTFTGTPLPPTLANTGAFTNLSTLAVAPGIVPYEINVPFWSDNALKRRWFSVPNTNLTMVFNRDANWSFPAGTVWIKHFELELTNGVASSQKRLETRLLVKNAGGIYGATYRWGNSLTNATLVPQEGMDESFVMNDSGILRTQVWRYPSRAECLACHTAPAGYALGFNTAQLNREADYNGTVTNGIAALNLAGYFNTHVTGLQTLPALAHATNATASLDHRVRSYLAVNCAPCHQPSGAAQALWDGRFATPTLQAGIINGALINNAGNTNNRVLRPGSLTHSMLLTRISTRGPGQMPPLASSVVDAQSLALLSAWITNRPAAPDAPVMSP